MSPWASAIVLPCSAESKRASASFSCSMSWRKCRGRGRGGARHLGPGEPKTVERQIPAALGGRMPGAGLGGHRNVRQCLVVIIQFADDMPLRQLSVRCPVLTKSPALGVSWRRWSARGAAGLRGRPPGGALRRPECRG